MNNSTIKALLSLMVMGMHVCSDKGTGSHQRGDNQKNVKMR
jgi:hypothetical protein